MASYNRIVLMGNLTRDPQLSYTPANTAVCKFGIATSRAFKDRDGNSREEVCFIDCTLFGRGGEVFNQYMSKGRPVLVEGRLQFQQWTTPEGDRRSKHEVVVENFTFLGGRGGEAGGAPATAGAAGSGRDEPPPPVDDGIPF
jgi:single-strand DNA-binding protein